jgi:hypothetical protein
LRFDGGAELILRGQTEVELLSAGTARLVRGEVTVRATDDAAGFKLLTPAGEVIDLGTEFAARAEASGATEVHVLDGEVAFGKPRSANQATARPGEVLHAGKAIRIDGATAAPREVVLSAARFDEIVRGARLASRADLMSAYEGFSYAAGRHPSAELHGGRGWNGPWRSPSAAEAYRPDEDPVTALDLSADDIRPAWAPFGLQPAASASAPAAAQAGPIPASPTPAGPVPAGPVPAGALNLPTGTTSIARTLERPIDLGADGVHYFSCVVREPPSEAGLVDRRFGGVRFVLRSSTTSDELVSFGPSRIRRPGIRLTNGANFTSPLQIARNQTTLWVGKIIARRSGDDEIFFSVYSEHDLPGYAEPAVWQAASRKVRRSGVLDVVLFAGQIERPVTVDEIRIGPTWRSVAPMGEPLETARP